MVGIQLLTTVLALLVIDAIVPRRSPIAWISDVQHHTARARRYAQVSNIARRNGLVRQVGVRPRFGDHERNVAFARSLRRTLQVVVKVQRPGITTVVDRDLDIALRAAASLEQRAAWARDMGAVELAQGFAEALREELDFRVEARNLTTITASSALHRSSDRIRLPHVHGEFTTQRILVMTRRVLGCRIDCLIEEKAADSVHQHLRRAPPRRRSGR